MTSAINRQIPRHVVSLLSIETEKELLDLLVLDVKTFQSTIQTLEEDAPKCLTFAHAHIPKDLRKSLVKLGAREMRFVHCTMDEEDAVKIAFANSIRKVSFQGCTLTKPFDKQVQAERLESLGILKTKDCVSVFNPDGMECAKKLAYSEMSNEFLKTIDAPDPIGKIENTEYETRLSEQIQRGNMLISILHKFMEETQKQVNEITRSWVFVHPCYDRLSSEPKRSLDFHVAMIKKINTQAYEKTKQGAGCFSEVESINLLNELTQANNRLEREIDAHKGRRLSMFSCAEWEEF